MDPITVTAQAITNINALLTQKGWTQKVLGEKAGLAQPDVSRLMRPGRATSLATLTRVSEALGVQVWELLRPQSVTSDKLVPIFASEVGGIHLPFIGHVQAGGGVDDPADADATETVSVADTFRGASGVYRVRGRSMLGANIQEGDELIVKADPDPPSGELVIAWRKDGGAVVKRYYREGYERYMRSESTPGGEEDEGVIVFQKGDRIIGVVLGIQRKYATAPTPKGKASARKKGK